MSEDDDTRGEITRLLEAIRSGDRSAMDRLTPLVYDELHDRAHRQLHYGLRPPTLSTTDLVHETYLRLVGQTKPHWQDRQHFFSVAAKAMRSILVDYARRVQAQKRGGGARQVELQEFHLKSEAGAAEILDLDAALKSLRRLDERLCRIVELRCFGGLSVEETAGVLKLSPRTVKRDLRKARTLLYHALSEGSAGEPTNPA